MATMQNRGIPRQKSCSACAKAKRRCDFAVPTCLRCSNRDISCIYPERTKSSISRMRENRELLSSSPAESGDWLTGDLPLPPSPLQEPMLSLFGSGNALEIAPWTTMSAGWTGADPDLPISQGINLNSPPDENECPDEGDDSTDIVELATATLAPGLSTMPPMTWCPVLRPLSAAMSARIRYAIKYLSDIPKNLVKMLEIPWCHMEIFQRTETFPCLRG